MFIMKRVVYRILAGLIFCGLLGITSTILAAGGEWTQKADMPTARVIPSASVVDGKIYVIGGAIYDGWRAISLPTVEVYTPETNKWTEKPDMPAPRTALSNSVVDGKIYAIGGWNGVELSTVEEYDPKTGRWTKKADMPTARSFVSTSVVDGKIYAIGGSANINTVLPTVEEYDPATDTWTKKKDMPGARDCHSTSVVNGKIYVIGGVQAWQLPLVPLSTVEEYTPEGWPFPVSSEGKLVTTWGEIKRSHF